MSKTINVSLVGCGHRGREMLKRLYESKYVKANIIAFVDGVEEAICGLKPAFDYASFWASKEFKEKTDLVMVASINSLHEDHICKALSAGKYVFCEKPLFTEWNKETIEIIRKNSDRFCTGFVLRHSPFYLKIKELLPKIGKIKSGTVSDLLHYGHGALIFGGGWRHDPKLSGGHIVEKLVHVIDLLVWYLDSPVIRSEGFQGPDMWVKDKEKVSEEWIKHNNDNEKLLTAYEFYNSQNPFDHKKTEIVESSGNFTLQFNNFATVGIHFDTACPESRRQFFLVGEMGTLEALWTHTESWIKVTTCGVGTKASKGKPNKTEVFQFEPVGCHGGGDDFIIDALIRTVTCGDSPNPTAEEALRTMKSTLKAQEGLK